MNNHELNAAMLNKMKAAATIVGCRIRLPNHLFDDVVQESLLRFFRCKSEVSTSLNRDKVQAWMLATVRRVALEMRRKEVPRPLTDYAGREESTNLRTRKKRCHDISIEQIESSKLNKVQTDTIQMLMKRLSVKEIADQYGVTSQAIRDRFRRIERRIQEFAAVAPERRLIHNASSNFFKSRPALWMTAFHLYRAGKSYKSIGQNLGLTANAAKLLIRRIRRSINVD
ncbi:MAG: hypothetical protein ACKVS6_04775 [Planctomycetota bacterium]